MGIDSLLAFGPVRDAVKAANDEAERSDIKGQPYVAVNERIKAFRKVFPLGRITTETEDIDGICTCTANVYVPVLTENSLEMVLIATGTAREKDGSSYINKTSYVENCETSAVGRALGFAGFGIDKAVASADEVKNAELNDIGRKKISPEMVVALKKRCEKDGVNIKALCELYKIKALEDCTNNMYANMNQFWDKISVGGKHE